MTVPKDCTRDVAFKMLCKILMGKDTLDQALDKVRGVDPRDKKAAYRLAVEVLRRYGTLNAVLEPLIKKEPPKGVQIALMMGAAQLLFLDTPPHAALNTILELLEREKFGKFKGFANAILRRVSRESETVLDGLDQERLDTPAWIWSAWGKDARKIAQAYRVRAPLDVRFKADDAAMPSALTEIEGARVLDNGTVRLPVGTVITELEGFDRGSVWAQDAAAASIAPLLGDVAGKKIVDLCAAPGGKTIQLALEGAQVTAVEKSQGRMKRLKENLDRLGLVGSVKVVHADALRWRTKDKFDGILLDAPCSATGTFRRNPDVLHIKNEAELRKLSLIQSELLTRCADIIEPGGKLVYAVCSLLPAEGAEQIERAVESGLWKIDPIKPDEMPLYPQAVTEEGFVRTLPNYLSEIGGMDGFFAARLVRI